eukprot:2604008-Rhodomonas_salina.1
MSSSRVMFRIVSISAPTWCLGQCSQVGSLLLAVKAAPSPLGTRAWPLPTESRPLRQFCPQVSPTASCAPVLFSLATVPCVAGT